MTGFSMGETISSSVRLLFGVGGTREAMPVGLVLSGKIFEMIPKGGGLGGNPIQQRSSRFWEIRIPMDDGDGEWSIDGGGEGLYVGTICDAIGGRDFNLAGPWK